MRPEEIWLPTEVFIAVPISNTGWAVGVAQFSKGKQKWEREGMLRIVTEELIAKYGDIYVWKWKFHNVSHHFVC